MFLCYCALRFLPSYYSVDDLVITFATLHYCFRFSTLVVHIHVRFGNIPVCSSFMFLCSCTLLFLPSDYSVLYIYYLYIRVAYLITDNLARINSFGIT